MTQNVTSPLFDATVSEGVLVVRLTARSLSALRVIDRLERELTELEQRRAEARWVLDFAGVTFIVTQAIGALMVLLKRLRTRGGELVIIGLTEPIRSVFRLMKLDQILPLADSREQALAMLARVSERRPD